MKSYSKIVKEKLLSIIEEMASNPDLFVKNPGRDFTRNRKLSFETVIKLLLSMGGNAIYTELLDYFNYDVETASSSAFIQQRGKILPFTFEFLLNQFTSSFNEHETYQGYRLLAVDGSALNIAHNPKDTNTYFQSMPNSKGFNLLQLNAMYDVKNKIYVDAIIQEGKKRNEFKSLTEMVDRSKINDKVIIVADRGYESYNVFAHVEEKGWQYVIRVKDKNSNGILSSLELPKTEEFDVVVELNLTRKQTKEIKANPRLYKFIPKTSTFDYLGLKEKIFYPIRLRIVRIKLSEDSYETIITNLEKEQISSNQIKEIYHLRWGIETSFRELKYALGLTSFHSKKVAYITQEVFARLIMYNFCEIITCNIVIKQKPTKYGCQANFTVGIQICKYFFRCRDNVEPPDVEALIQKNILPVRKGRSAPRKIRLKTNISFNYRVA